MINRVNYAALALSGLILAGAIYLDWRAVTLTAVAYGTHRLRIWVKEWLK